MGIRAQSRTFEELGRRIRGPVARRIIVGPDTDDSKDQDIG